MKFLFKSFFKNELDELEKLKSDLKNYQAKEEELKTVKQSFLNSSSETQLLKNKVNELNNEINSLKSDLQQGNNNKISIQELDNVKRDYSNLLNQKENEIHLLNQEKIGLINQIESLKVASQTSNSSQELELIKQENNQLKSLLSQKEIEINNLNQEKNTLLSKLEELKADFNYVQNQNSGSPDSDLVKQENIQLKTVLSQKETELQNYISSQNALRERLALALKANDDYQQKVNDLDIVIKQLRDSASTTQSSTPVAQTVPVMSTPIPMEPQRSNRVEAPKRSTCIKNILVVDDSNIILMQVRKAMGSLPFHLQTAISAKKALEMLNNELFDLIITDVNMPEMNGIDLTLKLRKENKNLRVIIMTAFENVEMKKHKTNLLFTDKPLSLGNVTSLINQMEEGNDFGKLKTLKLKDFIFMLVLSKKDEYILVTDSKNNQGKVYFSCGDLIHAEYSNLKGKEALDAIAKFEDPSLDVIEGKTNERTINIDVNTILFSL